MGYYAIESKKNNELYHWKYLRKYRSPKGKHSWVYVYTDKDSHASIRKRIKEAEDANIQYDHALNELDNHQFVKALKEKDYRADLAQEYINLHSENLISDIANWIYDKTTKYD